MKRRNDSEKLITGLNTTTFPIQQVAGGRNTKHLARLTHFMSLIIICCLLFHINSCNKEKQVKMCASLLEVQT